MNDYNEKLCEEKHKVIEREFGIIHKRIDDRDIEKEKETQQMCLRIAALENDLIDHKDNDIKYKTDLGKGVINTQTKVILGLCSIVITLVLILFVAIMTGRVKII